MSACPAPTPESFAIEDANGVALAYVYFEGEPTRRGLVKRLPARDAKHVAQTIARALTEAAKSSNENFKEVA
ncbi:hypothetical protein [Methylocystis sp.]|uniref:hypothetical protein n=1 Tax=Methylocystis sp. TaxID=1911079 RepID=UPI0025E5FCA4|nr:hypothetical protein [Methylocystis sp.]